MLWASAVVVSSVSNAPWEAKERSGWSIVTGRNGEVIEGAGGGGGRPTPWRLGDPLVARERIRQAERCVRFALARLYWRCCDCASTECVRGQGVGFGRFDKDGRLSLSFPSPRSYWLIMAVVGCGSFGLVKSVAEEWYKDRERIV